jgi:hypothetical protein
VAGKNHQGDPAAGGRLAHLRKLRRRWLLARSPPPQTAETRRPSGCVSDRGKGRRGAVISVR